MLLTLQIQRRTVIGSSRRLCVFILICASFRAIVAGGMEVPANPPPANPPPANPATAPVAIVSRVSINPQPNGLTIEISVNAPIVPSTDRLTNPDRLIFDFAGCGFQGA